MYLASRRVRARGGATRGRSWRLGSYKYSYPASKQASTHPKHGIQAAQIGARTASSMSFHLSGLRVSRRRSPVGHPFPPFPLPRPRPCPHPHPRPRWLAGRPHASAAAHPPKCKPHERQLRIGAPHGRQPSFPTRGGTDQASKVLAGLGTRVRQGHDGHSHAVGPAAAHCVQSAGYVL